MKVKVTKDKCIGCGNCVSLTEGQVFDFDDEGYANCVVESIPTEMEETVKDAINQCPTDAISEDKSEEN